MITRELSKQLKEHGFPQMADGGESKKAYSIDGTVMVYNDGWPKEIESYIPTKKELVLAVGDDMEAVLAQAFLDVQNLTIEEKDPLDE